MGRRPDRHPVAGWPCLGRDGDGRIRAGRRFGIAAIVVLLTLSIGDRGGTPASPRFWAQGSEAIGDAMGETSATGVTRVGVPHPGELDSLFSRFVIVIVALVTLSGAWIAFLQADAFAHADRIEFQARREAITALIDGEATDSRASSQIVAYEDALISDVAVHGASQRLRYHESMSDEAMHHEAQTDLEHLTTIATALRPLASFPTEVGPGADPAFRYRLRAGSGNEFDRQEAEDEAHHDQSAEWQRRGAYYAALLVVLAVAVYLLGLSLILPGHRLPVGFALVAVGGLAFALVWSARTLVEEPASENANAAQQVPRMRRSPSSRGGTTCSLVNTGSPSGHSWRPRSSRHSLVVRIAICASANHSRR